MEKGGGGSKSHAQIAQNDGAEIRPTLALKALDYESQQHAAHNRGIVWALAITLIGCLFAVGLLVWRPQLWPVSAWLAVISTALFVTIPANLKRPDRG